VYTFGIAPYYNLLIEASIKAVLRGYSLARPDACPGDVYVDLNSCVKPCEMAFFLCADTTSCCAAGRMIRWNVATRTRRRACCETASVWLWVQHLSFRFRSLKSMFGDYCGMWNARSQQPETRLYSQAIQYFGVIACCRYTSDPQAWSQPGAATC
jgi:hypothetical protein